MQAIMETNTAFNILWVLINGLLYYAEIDFVLRFTGSHKRRYIPFYVVLNTLFTVMAIKTQMFGIFGGFRIVLLFFILANIFKIPPKYAITPIVIVFTLSSFMEGFVTVLMRFLSLSLESQLWGLVCQYLLPAGMAVLYFLTLRLIAKRYIQTKHNRISSYLYILLLPCVLMIWGIHTSLGLDSDTSKYAHGALINGEINSFLYAMIWIISIFVIFFIIIEAFHKITVLSQKEIEQALLSNQIKAQRGYIDEARQRNESYRSFQHDINNHLLVLSGLLHSKKYRQAENYLKKLDMMAKGLSETVSTRNSVLDVLLWEKIRYAKQYNISIICNVQIPKESAIDDIDLCILFSNGIDNAINACMNVALEHRTITLTVKQKHTFMLIDMVNGLDYCVQLTYGTGLKNIELIAKKYGGVMRTEQEKNQFSLSILLCYSQISNKYDLQSTDVPLT